jgi:hypothetical protein
MAGVDDRQEPLFDPLVITPSPGRPPQKPVNDRFFWHSTPPPTDSRAIFDPVDPQERRPMVTTRPGRPARKTTKGHHATRSSRKKGDQGSPRDPVDPRERRPRVTLRPGQPARKTTKGHLATRSTHSMVPRSGPSTWSHGIGEGRRPDKARSVSLPGFPATLGKRYRVSDELWCHIERAQSTYKVVHEIRTNQEIRGHQALRGY